MKFLLLLPCSLVIIYNLVVIYDVHQSINYWAEEQTQNLVTASDVFDIAFITDTGHSISWWEGLNKESCSPYFNIVAGFSIAKNHSLLELDPKERRRLGVSEQKIYFEDIQTTILGKPFSRSERRTALMYFAEGHLGQGYGIYDPASSKTYEIVSPPNSQGRTVFTYTNTVAGIPKLSALLDAFGIYLVLSALVAILISIPVSCLTSLNTLFVRLRMASLQNEDQGQGQGQPSPRTRQQDAITPVFPPPVRELPVSPPGLSSPTPQPSPASPPTQLPSPQTLQPSLTSEPPQLSPSSEHIQPTGQSLNSTSQPPPSAEPGATSDHTSTEKPDPLFPIYSETSQSGCQFFDAADPSQLPQSSSPPSERQRRAFTPMSPPTPISQPPEGSSSLPPSATTPLAEIKSSLKPKAPGLSSAQAIDVSPTPEQPPVPPPSTPMAACAQPEPSSSRIAHHNRLSNPTHEVSQDEFAENSAGNSMSDAKASSLSEPTPDVPTKSPASGSSDSQSFEHDISPRNTQPLNCRHNVRESESTPETTPRSNQVFRNASTRDQGSLANESALHLSAESPPQLRAAQPRAGVTARRLIRRRGVGFSGVTWGGDYTVAFQTLTAPLDLERVRTPLPATCLPSIFVIVFLHLLCFMAIVEAIIMLSQWMPCGLWSVKGCVILAVCELVSPYRDWAPTSNKLLPLYLCLIFVSTQTYCLLARHALVDFALDTACVVIVHVLVSFRYQFDTHVPLIPLAGVLDKFRQVLMINLQLSAIPISRISPESMAAAHSNEGGNGNLRSAGATTRAASLSMPPSLPSIPPPLPSRESGSSRVGTDVNMQQPSNIDSRNLEGGSTQRRSGESSAIPASENVESANANSNTDTEVKPPAASGSPNSRCAGVEEDVRDDSSGTTHQSKTSSRKEGESCVTSTPTPLEDAYSGRHSSNANDDTSAHDLDSSQGDADTEAIHTPPHQSDSHSPPQSARTPSRTSSTMPIDSTFPTHIPERDESDFTRATPARLQVCVFNPSSNIIFQVQMGGVSTLRGQEGSNAPIRV